MTNLNDSIPPQETPGDPVGTDNDTPSAQTPTSRPLCEVLHRGAHCQVVAVLRRDGNIAHFELWSSERQLLGTYHCVTCALEEADSHDKSVEEEDSEREETG